MRTIVLSLTLCVGLTAGCSERALGPPRLGLGSDGDAIGDSQIGNLVPPWADAGSFLKTESGAARLDGSASGGPKGEPLSFRWSQTLGPPAEIVEPDSILTDIRMSTTGLYVFEIEVSNRLLSDTDEVMVWHTPSEDPVFVIHISIDGLRADIIEVLGPQRLPGFAQLQETGAFTHDARTDVTHTITLPNHTTELTGRPVLGDRGHNWILNYHIPGSSIHDRKGAYVASVFDVVHDHGLRTALFSGKQKFTLFVDSFDQAFGAQDTVGDANGRNKIDHAVITTDPDTLVDSLLASLREAPHHYTFLHLAEADLAGHIRGWDPTPESDYSLAVESIDRTIQKILLTVAASDLLAGRTTILLTADHGGTGSGHADETTLENYRIPFYAWGRGVDEGVDLYDLNSDRRQRPGVDAPDYYAEPQPIRNGGIGNAASHLLGLPSIPGSSINAATGSRLRFSAN